MVVTMSRSLLAAMGIGGLRLSLALDQSTYPRGGRLSGSVRIEGGSLDQYVKMMRVDLLPYGVTCGGLSNPSRFGSNQGLADAWIEARSDTSVAFAIRVPDDASLNDRLGVIWRVRALAAIWGTFLSPCAELPVTVVPHPEVTAVHRAMAHFGFSTGEAPSTFFSLPRRTVHGVETFHSAPLGLRDQVSGVTLHLAVRDSVVEGWMTFKRTPHSLGERIGGVAPDVIRFTIPRDVLVTRQGAPQSLGAVPTLQSVLLEALIFPENANERTLLRASEMEARDLLRPASGGGAGTDTLVRSIESAEHDREAL